MSAADLIDWTTFDKGGVEYNYCISTLSPRVAFNIASKLHTKNPEPDSTLSNVKTIREAKL